MEMDLKVVLMLQNKGLVETYLSIQGQVGTFFNTNKIVAVEGEIVSRYTSLRFSYFKVNLITFLKAMI